MTDDRLIVERCSWRGRSSREDIFFFFFSLDSTRDVRSSRKRGLCNSSVVYILRDYFAFDLSVIGIVRGKKRCRCFEYFVLKLIINCNY